MVYHLLGKLSGGSLVQKSETGLPPASDLPGHCLDSVPACKHSKSGSILDKKGSGSWNSWAPGGLASPPGSKKSYDSQGKTNSIVKIKVKSKLHFCTQTDDDISLQPWIANRSPSNWNWKSYPWNGCTTWNPFPGETPDCYDVGLPSAVEVWM